MMDFVSRSSRMMMSLVTATLLFMTSFGLCMLAFGPIPAIYEPNGIIPNAMSGLLVVLCGACGLVGVVRLIQPREELRVGANGVYWSRYSDKLIPWSEIKRVSWRSYRGHRFFVLHLRDRNSFPPHGMEKFISFASRLLSDGDIWISMNAMDRRCGEALSAFEALSPSGVMFQVAGRKHGAR